MGEGSPEALPVQVEVLDLMATGDHPRGSAAREDGLGGKLGGFYRIGLEKAHRQKGDLLQAGDAGRTHSQGVGILAVERIMLVLKPEKFEGPGCEILRNQIVKKFRMHPAKLLSFN